MAEYVPLVHEGFETMTKTDKIQFSRQIWQAASEHAHRCLTRLAFCPDQSRIENLRHVHLVDESESEFGRQLWCFEAIGMDAAGRRHVLYGVLEFSIQYGLLEASQTGMFDNLHDRETFIRRVTQPIQSMAYSYKSTKFWIYAAWCSISILTAIWLAALVNHLYTAG